MVLSGCVIKKRKENYCLHLFIFFNHNHNVLSAFYIFECEKV